MTVPPEPESDDSSSSDDTDYEPEEPAAPKKVKTEHDRVVRCSFDSSGNN